MQSIASPAVTIIPGCNCCSDSSNFRPRIETDDNASEAKRKIEMTLFTHYDIYIIGENRRCRQERYNMNIGHLDYYFLYGRSKQKIEFPII
jgi:hypothetical protein